MRLTKQVWRIGSLKIGMRLALCFSAILILMAAGSVLAVWEFQSFSRQAEQLDEIDHQVIAVLRANSQVVAYQETLQNAVAEGRHGQFRTAILPFRERIDRDLSGACQALQGSANDARRHAMTIAILTYFRTAIADQISAVVAMADAGDWQAIQLRLDNQVRSMGRVFATLTQDTDAEAVVSRRESFAGMQRDRKRGLFILFACGLCTLLATGILAVAATRSIAGPLHLLEASANSLGNSHFECRVELNGENELAQLAKAHNRAARRLQELYDALSSSEAHFRSLIENACEVIMVMDAAGIIQYASPASGRILAHRADALVGSRFSSHLIPGDAEQLHSILAAAKDPGAVASVELNWLRTDNAPQTLESIISNRMDDPSVGGIVINSRDVTARKRGEAEIRKLNEDLELRVAQRTHELEIARMRAELLATIDSLTGVFNRRGLLDRAERDLQLAARSRRPTAAAMFDIDHFKQVNDKYGHREGDRVLKQVVDTARNCVRVTDLFGRIGGEEFLVVMPDTTIEAAGQVAERIRQAIEQEVTAGTPPLPVTASFGVACVAEPGSNLDWLQSAADAALYEAKRAGRNRTSFVGDDWRVSGQLLTRGAPVPQR